MQRCIAGNNPIERNVHLYLFFLEARSLAKCLSVNRYFKAETEAVIEKLSEYVSETYYHSGLFERTNPLYLPRIASYRLWKIATPRLIIIRGILVYQMRIKYNTWERCGDTRRDRGHFSAAVLRGEIYAVGTFSITAGGTVEKFNAFLNRWVSQPSLPKKVRKATAVALGDCLYVIGGYNLISEENCGNIYYHRHNSENKHSSRDSCEVNDSGDYWQDSNMHLLKSRSYHCAGVHNGCIWVAGGCISEREGYGTQRDVEIFDPSTNTIREGPLMCVPRRSAHMVDVNGSLYAVGGDVDDQDKEITRTIEKYDDADGCWKMVTTFKDSRRGFSCCVKGDRIYVFGGSYQGCSELYNDTWDAFDTAYDQWVSDIRNKYDKMPMIEDWGEAVAFPASKVTWTL